MKINNLNRAMAMKCFGGLVEVVEKDPDPETQDKLQEEYNCKNCITYDYCQKLADTLDSIVPRSES